MPADLIVYALVAAGLVFWLKSILGTRHGEERQRPDPFAGNPEEATPIDGASAQDASHSSGAEDSIKDLAANPTDTLSVENKTAEMGLIDISNADKNFDVAFFLEAVQDVFVMVVEGFGKGDRELLSDLLGKEVYSAFDGALIEREKKEETLENEIQAIRKVGITDAKLDGKKAFVTVRFLADEVTVTKDSDGEIISGHPDKVSAMRDLWVFSRDVKSRDPRWLVAETRGDIDEDNETIPNTHE